MKVAWTVKAEKQLDHIFEYIAEDSALYAYRTVEKIIEQAESLVPYPPKKVEWFRNMNEKTSGRSFIIPTALFI